MSRVFFFLLYVTSRHRELVFCLQFPLVVIFGCCHGRILTSQPGLWFRRQSQDPTIEALENLKGGRVWESGPCASFGQYGGLWSYLLWPPLEGRFFSLLLTSAFDLLLPCPYASLQVCEYSPVTDFSEARCRQFHDGLLSLSIPVCPSCFPLMLAESMKVILHEPFVCLANLILRPVSYIW